MGFQFIFIVFGIIMVAMIVNSIRKGGSHHSPGQPSDSPDPWLHHPGIPPHDMHQQHHQDHINTHHAHMHDMHHHHTPSHDSGWSSPPDTSWSNPPDTNTHHNP